MLMDTELDATQQDFVVTAQESGKALINLINEVLDLAKIESGRIELEAVPFDVRDILDNVVSLFSEKSQTKGIEVSLNLKDGFYPLQYCFGATDPLTIFNVFVGSWPCLYLIKFQMS